ncbi:MAG: class I SAM-dependent methyltransferase [Armatimonadetes bacterium]|nr:class I SAM-dependent methyltransferase [Armatimonadota bacterium]
MGVKATRNDFVLDVGSGGHPHSTADVLVERFLDDSPGHRSHAPVVADRPLICADIHNLPFRDKAFDYVICNHVVEHVDDPGAALAEICRVGKRGFLGLPTEFYEFICPSPTHQWVFARKGDTILFKRKQDLHAMGARMYGGIFFDFYQLPEFKKLIGRRSRAFGISLEWDGKIEFAQVSDDTPFYNYSDPESVGELLELTLPGEPGEIMKAWLRDRLSQERIDSLSRLKTSVRRLLKPGSRR